MKGYITIVRWSGEAPRYIKDFIAKYPETLLSFDEEEGKAVFVDDMEFIRLAFELEGGYEVETIKR